MKLVDISIYGLETAIQALESIQFTSEDATDKEEISLKVYLENENYPEIDIAFVGGESFARVSRSDVVDLIEAVNSIILDKSADDATEAEDE